MRSTNNHGRLSATMLLVLLACASGFFAVGSWALAGGSDEPKPDPIKANGPIFVDWPQPKAVLILTGQQEGYLEPCGCAGLTNQKGGLKRRSTFLKELRDDGWPVVALDAGGLVKRFGQQAQIKYRHAVESLVKLGYAGVGLGTKDLKMDVLGVALNIDPNANPYVSANVGILGFDEAFSQRWRVTEAGGVKVGFTSVLADSQAKTLGDNADFTIEPAEVGLKKATEALKAQDCDELVLMVYGDRESARDLARKFPAYRWIVSALGADEPPHRAEQIDGTASWLIEVGHKGMYAVAIGLYDKATAEAGRAGAVKLADGDYFRYQKVPLDHRFEDAADMQQMMVTYQQELKTLGLEGLGIKPIVHPAAQIGAGRFAGSEVCGDCHDEEYEIWKNSPHYDGTESIVELDPPRHFDPECLSCHVTGWEPQKYIPFVSGYLSLEETPHLVTQGCENCHGPAAEHVAAEMGDINVSDERMEELQQALHMEIVENEGNKDGQEFKNGLVVQNCMRCHDLDNSPDFDFQEYWEHGGVKHGGNDDD